MTGVLVAVVVVLLIALAALGAMQFGPGRRGRHTPPPPTGARRILFPFVAQALVPRALDVALRLARAEDASLVPVFLARVPLHLPLDAPLPRQSEIAIPLQEAIEQRAASFEVPVDARIERGRSYRHALRQTLEHERFDRIVIAAAAHAGPGFDPDDVAWLLENSPGEIVIMRPDPDRASDLPAPPRGSARRRRAHTARRPPLSATPD
jgi:hypothetical protein